MDNDIFDLVRPLDISSVISRYIPVRGRGRARFLCPFHKDTKLGSFSVYEGRWFNCFSCGAHGDAVEFVKRFKGLSAVDAALEIAVDHNRMSAAEAEQVRQGKKIPTRCLTPGEPAPVEDRPQMVSRRVSAARLHQVYSAFVRAADPLTDEFSEHLRTVRKIGEGEMGDYFTFPSRSDLPAFYGRFLGELRREFGPFEDEFPLLRGVPGFFQTWQHETMFATRMERALGIVVRNRDGYISGIQTRAMTGDKGLRYRFLSSGFANGAKRSPGKWGCSCGYVEDVAKPLRWNGAIAVTEGHFKAVTLARLGFVVVNMHSIANAVAAAEVAISISEAVKAPGPFILAYDAELQNGSVVYSAKTLYENLAGHGPVEFAAWPPQYGKGIDDVVNSGHVGEISRISPESFFAKCVSAS